MIRISTEVTTSTAAFRIARKLLLDIAGWACRLRRVSGSGRSPVHCGSRELGGHRCPHHRKPDHREMAGGLSMPVGFKNGTDGSLQTAVDAMLSARHPHHFLGIDQDGAVSVVRTAGNPDGHVVLRGGRARTNYDAASIADAAAQLAKAGLPTGLMVDCSRELQQAAREAGKVWQNLVSQRVEGCEPLIG